MKICFLGRAFNLFSGTSKPLYDLALTLSQMGNDVTIVTTKIDSTLEKGHSNLIREQNSFNVNVLNSMSVYKGMIHQNQDLILLKKIIENCDVIHGFDFLTLYEINFLLKKLKIKKPLIYSASGSFKISINDWLDSGLPSFLNVYKPSFLFKFLFPEMGYKKVFNGFDKIIASSEFVKKELNSMDLEDKVAKVPVGLNTDYLNQFNKYTHNHKYDFIYFGWGSSIRGVPDIIVAFEKVLMDYPESKLGIFFLGSHGIEEKMYSYLINNNKKLSGAVDLVLGAKLNMMEIIKSSKSVILPFRTHFGYSQPPLTILESMILERPVISTNVGSIPEIISNGENGYLVNPKKPDELAKKMLYILEEDMNSITENARNYVIRNHEVKDKAKNICDIYQSVL